MVRFLADENFNYNIVCGLRRLDSRMDIARAQDVGLGGANDAVVLDWAAAVERVILTHDVSTMSHYAYERVRQGSSMPGVFEVGRAVSIKSAIDEIHLIAHYSAEGEREGQVRYLPLR